MVISVFFIVDCDRMADELRSSDIRELIFEYDSDDGSDISIGNDDGEVPCNVRPNSESELGVDISKFVTFEILDSSNVGLGPSTSFSPGESQVGTSLSRPTVVYPYVASITSDFSPKSSPLPPSPGSPEHSSEHGSIELFTPPSPVPPSPPPPMYDIESDSSESSVSDSSIPLDKRSKIPKWTRVFPPEPERNIENEFKVRNSGVRNCPPRNSNPILYFYLFFLNF